MITPESLHILVVDDELGMREFLDFILTKKGYRVSLAESGRAALKHLRGAPHDLVLCDIKLGDMTGIDILKEAKSIDPHVPVVMISAFASAETAVDAMNYGAYDYLPKPFDNRELLSSIENALKLRTPDLEKKAIEDERKQNLHFGSIVGNCPAMMRIYEIIKEIAPTRTNVLITGESGTGKEKIAESIHSISGRQDKPFVVISCGGIPENLMESEFFGYRKGAFTGAGSDKKGLLESANGGTVFLDEIGELPLALQVKLLRAVQERKFKAVGGIEDIKVDIRFVAATNKSLEKEVIAGNFREDLYYRLNVIEIRMPPLRERKNDIKALAQHFLEKYSSEMGKEIRKMSSYALDLLCKYDFPGNIRELENIIERSVALSTTNIILPESLSISLHKRRRWVEGLSEGRRYDLKDVEKGVEIDRILAEIEEEYVKKAMDIAGGNKTKAAELLGINLRSLRYRLGKFGEDSGSDENSI